MTFPPAVLATLGAATLVTSIFSGMTGMAGGVILFSVMASLLDAALVVPLHAAVQFASNTSRLFLFLRHVKWKIVLCFTAGMIPGALIGIKVFTLLNGHLIKLGMGLFIMAVVFLPERERDGGLSTRVFLPLGFVAGLLGIFFGSLGPLTADFFIRANVTKEELVGTKAACQAAGHLMKLPLFGLIGVNVLDYSGVLFWLVLAVIAGTMVGKRLLKMISPAVFRVLFRTILVLIAGRLVVVEILALAG